MDTKGQFLGVTGLVLGITGLAFSILAISDVEVHSFRVSTSVSIPSLLGAMASIPCVAIGLPLSGAAFHQARESGTHTGIPVAIAGLVTGVAATVFSSWMFWVVFLTWI